MTSRPLLEAQGLDVAIGDRVLCRGLDLRINAGESLAILGRNGVGKSTLLATLAGLRPAAAGTIRFEGADLATLPPRQLARRRGYLPQVLHDPFTSSVMETVLIGRHPHLGRWEWESDGDRQLAAAALAAVRLDDLAEREVHTLSGGERQRLGLAMLLVQAPRLFLLDEPLAHLDPSHGLAALGLLRARQRDDGVGAVLVLHDANLALRWCDRALLMFGDGEWLEGPVAQVLAADTLSRLYGYPLRALDDAGRPWFVAA